MEHLRKHTKEYVGAVHGFLDDVYFSRLPSSASDSDSNEVLETAEMEEEEESRGNNAKRAAIAK